MTASTSQTPTEQVYDLLLQLLRRNHLTPRSELPTDGVYVFFEQGETTQLRGAVVDRIVRVGTHKKDGNFRARIRQHYGHLHSLGGNKNGSVFRKHLGGALLRRRNPIDQRLPGWLKHMGPSDPEVEEEVSRVLRDRFSCACFAVPTAVERLTLESGLIALLAQQPLGTASPDWLGLFAASEKIRTSGLWNTNEVDATPLTPRQLARLEDLIGSGR